MRDKKKYATDFIALYWLHNMPKTMTLGGKSLFYPSTVRIPVTVMIRYAKELGLPIITSTQPPVTLVPQSPKNKLLSS